MVSWAKESTNSAKAEARGQNNCPEQLFFGHRDAETNQSSNCLGHSIGFRDEKLMRQMPFRM